MKNKSNRFFINVKNLLIELVGKGINKEYRCYNSCADLRSKLKVLAIRTRRATNQIANQSPSKDYRTDAMIVTKIDIHRNLINCIEN